MVVENSRIEKLLLMLMSVIIILMVMSIGLFLRMNQLQSLVVQALAPLQGAFQPSEGLAVGTQAPHFSLTSTGGQIVSLTDYDEGSLLLVFSSTTCPACQDKHPMLKAFNELHPDFTLLIISKGSEEDNQTLVQEQGFTFPVLIWKDEVADAYQVPGVPHFYVIENGMVAYGGFATSVEELENLAGLGQ